MKQKWELNAKKPVMKCGCVANAYRIDRETHEKHWCCIIHDTVDILEEELDLSGRQAKCTICGKMVDSDLNLPFFEYNKNGKMDQFYCGCKGWD